MASYDQIIFCDLKEDRFNLLPLTYTRPAAELRIGIDTIREKWLHYFNVSYSYITQPYLQGKYSAPATISISTLIVNGSIIPNEKLATAIDLLKPGMSLWQNDIFIAHRGAEDAGVDQYNFLSFDKGLYAEAITRLSKPWHLFQLNDLISRNDFIRITSGRESQPIPASTRGFGSTHFFIEEGAEVSHSVINADEGPVYLAKGSQILEGCTIRGPLALCNDSVLKMGARVYGATTIGPGSRFGGEIKNIVVQGNSNKAHDGYLGNAVLGEWCNLGADSNSSNLSNNYGKLKVWDYGTGNYEQTNLQLCGLIMGDHSKCGINTMFNTATVVGVAANIFGAGFPKKFIPSFTWGGADFMRTFILNKAFEMAEAMMSRRSMPFSHEDKAILDYIFKHTAQYRIWEK